MKLLLDTCALLWLVGDREHLSDAALEAMSAPDTELFVSAISAFEIAVKARKGRLALTHPAREWFERAVRAHRLIEALFHRRSQRMFAKCRWLMPTLLTG